MNEQLACFAAGMFGVVMGVVTSEATILATCWTIDKIRLRRYRKESAIRQAKLNRDADYPRMSDRKSKQ